VNADDRDENANDGNHVQSRDGNDLSKYGIHDLQLINAHYKALVLERREKIRQNTIRQIEASCEELGLNVRQQDWAAVLRGLTAASESRPGITADQRDFSQGELQGQANPSQEIEPMPISETQFAQEPEAMLIDDGPALRETALGSLRLLLRRKRAHSQLERQSADTADNHEDGEAEEVADQLCSPDRTESLHSGDGEDEPGGEDDSVMLTVDAVANRTAWSVVLDKYPDEIAMVFRAGRRPENRQVSSMVSSSHHVRAKTSRVNAQS
jgi:hypothetical protein